MPHFLGSRVFNTYILKTRVFNIYTYILKPDYQESGAFRPKVGHCDHGVQKCGGIATSRLGHCDFEIGALDFEIVNTHVLPVVTSLTRVVLGQNWYGFTGTCHHVKN